MEWTPEAVRAEVDRRHEVAQHSALVRQIKEARGTRPSWWRRLRSHPGDDESAEDCHLEFKPDSAA